MKKLIPISALLLAAGQLTAQAAGTQPKESQSIGVEEQQGPQTSPVVRTISTKKGYTVTTTVPETF